MTDVCIHGKTLNETCTACFPDDKAPELIYMQLDDLSQFESGMHARFSDDDIAYRRADLAHLPEDLVERLREVLSYESSGVVEHDAQILREILKAVER